MGAIEFLLYNMGSMLAGVAAGYDVRLSNVTPIHPKLHPNRPSEGEEERKFWFGDPNQQKVSQNVHNTYHGPTVHHRAPLTLDFKPLRFTDSPQTGRKTSQISERGRRRSSNVSNDSHIEVHFI